MCQSNIRIESKFIGDLKENILINEWNRFKKNLEEICWIEESNADCQGS